MNWTTIVEGATSQETSKLSFGWDFESLDDQHVILDIDLQYLLNFYFVPLYQSPAVTFRSKA
jgi:hypothetical protein